MIQKILQKLIEKKTLTTEELQSCFQQMMSGKVSHSLMAAFLVALRMKGEVAEELIAAANALRNAAVPFKSNVSNLVDSCGTGGDHSNTFNISTAAALVAAAAGAKVAKHGNRSVSSQTGSADVLEALGVRVEISPQLAEKCLEHTGFAFLYAPLYHPTMKNVAEVRKELGIRTIFNLVGPLANPAHVKRQLMGVWDESYIDLMGEVLLKLGCQKALVVRSHDGLDEISLTTFTEVCELHAGKLTHYQIYPDKLGLKNCTKKDLLGGDAKTNAQIIEAILEGEKGPRRDVVVLNAAAVLYVSDLVREIEVGIEKANEAIHSGKAKKVLEELRRLTSKEEMIMN